MKKRTLLVALTLVFLALPVSTAMAQTTQPANDAFQEAQPQPQATDANAPAANEPGAPAPETAQRQNEPIGMWFWVVLLGGFFLLYWWSNRSRRKQEQKRKEMLTSLKKGDKVTTIGGIVGSVVEIREDEVTLKVDETNNVRMKFARWGIRGVGEDSKTQGPEDKK